MNDFIIKGGRVIDPATNRNEIGDIAILNGKIVEPSDKSKYTIDAKNYYVFPGFVDWHTHLFTTGSSFGLNPDLLFSSGTTTAVDMGSSGVANVKALIHELSTRQMNTKLYLNVSPIGQVGYGVNEPLDNQYLLEDKISFLVEEHRDKIKGLKLRLSKQIVGDNGIKPLERAVEIAKKVNLPLCVHTTNPPCGADDILNLLEDGDIFTHIYHNEGNTILNGDSLLDEVWKARAKGVKFDVGNGRVNFNFEVAKAALKEKFYPDIISTDATPVTHLVGNSMKSMPYMLSKFMALGMSLEEVIKCATINPAKLLDLESNIGSLAYGANADVVICEIVDKKVEFADSNGNICYGNKLILPKITISKGQIVYCDNIMAIK